MKLYEYEAKCVLSSYGIPIPRGKVAATPYEARKAATELKPPLVVKAQVLVAGRGKAGGILYARNNDEVEEVATRLFVTKVKGITVKELLVEEQVPTIKELYVGLTIDRAQRGYVVIASSLGGMDIEEVAAKSSLSMVRIPVNPRDGLSLSAGQQIAEKMGYHKVMQKELANIIITLCRAGMDYDTELMETNPIVETPNGHFVAVDARMIVDDNSLFRHQDMEKLRFAEGRESTTTEIEASRKGLVYVKLDGNIGVIGNGAGLVMATLDMIQYYGGKPADFLDLGGGAPVERIGSAIRIVLSNPAVKVIFVNILGGMTRCDDVARAITQVANRLDVTKPFVVRLIGTKEAEGKRILEESEITVSDSMEEAAKRAVEASRGA